MYLNFESLTIESLRFGEAFFIVEDIGHDVHGAKGLCVFGAKGAAIVGKNFGHNGIGFGIFAFELENRGEIATSVQGDCVVGTKDALLAGDRFFEELFRVSVATLA